MRAVGPLPSLQRRRHAAYWLLATRARGVVRASLVGNLCRIYRRRRTAEGEKSPGSSVATRRVGAEAEGTESAEHDRGRERRPSESLARALSLSFSLSPLVSLSSLRRSGPVLQCVHSGRPACTVVDNGIALPGPSVFRAKHRSFAVLVFVNVYTERVSWINDWTKSYLYRERRRAPGPGRSRFRPDRPREARGHGARRLVPERNRPRSLHGRYPSAAVRLA